MMEHNDIHTDLVRLVVFISVLLEQTEHKNRDNQEYLLLGGPLVSFCGEVESEINSHIYHHHLTTNLRHPITVTKFFHL